MYFWRLEDSLWELVLSFHFVSSQSVTTGLGVSDFTHSAKSLVCPRRFLTRFVNSNKRNIAN